VRIQPFGPQTKATFSTFEAGESGASGIADAVPAAARLPSAASPISTHLSFMVSSCFECEQGMSERGALNSSLK
jgi:hypothetical protein